MVSDNGQFEIDNYETHKNNKDAFLEWVESTLPPRRCKWIEENILKIGQLAVDYNVISGSIFDVIDLPTLQTIYKTAEKSKVFKIKNKKFLKNIKDDFNVYVQYCLHLSEKTNQLTTENTAKSVSYESGIVAVLKQYYEYGFKYDSIRELMRFRQFADEMGVSVPEKDEELKASILSCGIVINGKVYLNRDDMLQELKSLINDIFSSGVCVIYYESLFENKKEWMASNIITSFDMLKEYIRKTITECSYSKKFMVKGDKSSEKEAVTDEIKRVWGSHPIENVDDLSKRLPYIPIENIIRVISGNDFFIRNSTGEYLFIDYFRITEDEEKNILNFVAETCDNNGFASISNVPLGSIEEENYELTLPAIYNAVYKKILSGKYYLNGKILTREKSGLDTVTLLKQYINGKDECTFSEIEYKVVELIAIENRQYALQALYDEMVRVDKNRFVANRFVNFSVDEIDTVLSEFITGNFKAIRDVTTFAMFPLCGQNWNHYLLESFCYKYSKKYSLHLIHFNDKNAGIIAEKDFNKSYNEMLAIAVARSDIELTPSVIGQYLFNNGYLAKSKYTKLDEIAQQASKIRKKR